MSRHPIETKVIAATTGSAAGSAVGGFVLWLLGVTVWHVSFTADHAGDAIGAVPAPVTAAVLFVLGVIGTLVGGWSAPHSPRPTGNLHVTTGTTGNR